MLENDYAREKSMAEWARIRDISLTLLPKYFGVTRSETANGSFKRSVLSIYYQETVKSPTEQKAAFYSHDKTH